MIEIPLTQGQVALIGDEDYPIVSHHKWHAHRSGDSFHAATNVNIDGCRVILFMHNLISPPSPGLFNDHINHNGCDNCRSNLRHCTRQQNAQNHRKNHQATSQFIGVSWCKGSGKWQANIRHNGKRYYLGLFDSETDAAHAYDRAAIELFGEFANTNFPRSDYE